MLYKKLGPEYFGAFTFFTLNFHYCGGWLVEFPLLPVELPVLPVDLPLLPLPIDELPE